MRRFFNNIVNYFISWLVNLNWRLRLRRLWLTRYNLRLKWLWFLNDLRLNRFWGNLREFLGRWYLRLWYWLWDRFR
jgi:hypothetical protein